MLDIAIFRGSYRRQRLDSQQPGGVDVYISKDKDGRVCTVTLNTLLKTVEVKIQGTEKA